MNHGVISILPLYETIRLHKYQQEIIETCLQVLHIEQVFFICATAIMQNYAFFGKQRVIGVVSLPVDK